MSLPTVVGESYSPDFMYIVKRKNGAQELNVIIESKDVGNIKEETRRKEQKKICCAKVFFDQLTQDGYRVNYVKQAKTDKVLGILNDLQ